MKFCEKIVRLRRIRGITQDELASAVGVSRQAVYKWECGQSYPEVMKLLEIKELFGISIDDLLDESYEIDLPDRKKRRRIKRSRAAAIERSVEEELAAVTEAEEPILEEEITVVEVDATPAIEDSEELIRESIVEAVTVPEEVFEESSAEEDVVTEELNATTVTSAEENYAQEQTLVAEEEVLPEAPDAEAAPMIEEAAEEDNLSVNAPAAEEEPKPEKKRGFFSRLFGRR